MLLNRQRVKFWQRIIFGGMAVLMAGFLVFGYSGVASSCKGNNGTVKTGNSVLDSQIKTATATLKTTPNDPTALLQLAQAYQSAGFSQATGSPAQATDLAKAIDYYSRYLALKDAQLGGDAPSLRFQALTNLAGVQVRLFDLKGAVATYRKMIKLQPRNSTLYLQLGSAAVNSGQTKVAITAFTTFLKLDPKSQYAAPIKQELAKLSGATSPAPSGSPAPSPSPTK